MLNLLYGIVYWVAGIHNRIIGLNYQYGYNFDDKTLHFITIGAFGLLMVFVIYPLFKWLAKHGHVMVIAFLYVFTVIVGLTFAIEIGQGWTGTGAMEFDDIAYGIVGFLIMFIAFAFVRFIFNTIVGAFRGIEVRRY